VEQREQAAERHAHDQAKRQTARVEPDGEAAHRADEHHALDAQVHHAGALREDFANRRKE
jgi:hypothetical protein